MFTAKQVKLMKTLGITTSNDQEIFYEGYCEVSCEMRAEGMNPGTFTEYLERRIQVAEYLAKRKQQTV